MSQHVSAAPGCVTRALHDWRDAVVTVLAGMAAMIVMATLGLWAAGAAELPDASFPRVVTAVVVMAVGGSVELSGGAGFFAQTNAAIDALPLSVSVAGALVTAAGFLRPLRHRAVAGTPELLGRVARIALLWLVALIVVVAVAHHEFELPLGNETARTLAEPLGITPTAGFRADMALTLVFGLLWLLGVLALALLVSRKAPLPVRLVRLQEPVRPVAFAVVALLLAYVALGTVVGVVVAATHGHPADTFAVIFLALPNIAWLALGLGLGASWEGKVNSPIGLPMPRILDQVLRGSETTTLNLSSMAEHDARVWWLPVVAAVLLLAAAFVMVVRSPARMRPWQHALHLAAALALTMLMICLVTRISAHYGLSLIGIGDIAAFGGEVSLQPHLWTAIGLGALWGLVAGFLAGLVASRVHRKGEVERGQDPPVGTG
ncbi:streptophobe family protein [Streptomyces sannanensis]|uniref:Streptophobe family protein n=1 Tax=Streptomyces sannanensis TaxID=285536 RepID=A0ABP6S3R5_9ACTN